MQGSFYLSPHLHTPSTPTPFSPSRISFMVSVDVKHHYLLTFNLLLRVPLSTPSPFHFQTNFYLDVDDTEDPPCSGPALCEMCEEGQQQEATHSCRDCQQRMCRSCRRLHDRVTGARDHRVEPVTTQPRSQPANLHDAKGKKLCQSHPDQALCFHCSKCDVSICLHCKLTSHEGHMTEDMATAAARAREELTTLLLTAEEQVNTFLRTMTILFVCLKLNQTTKKPTHFNRATQNNAP